MGSCRLRNRFFVRSMFSLAVLLKRLAIDRAHSSGQNMRQAESENNRHEYGEKFKSTHWNPTSPFN